MTALPLALAFLADATAALAAVAPDPLQDIRNVAIAAVGAVPAEAQATLDPALRLSPCSQPLQATASGPRTALVRCADSPGWRVYVPVQVYRQADVVVLTAPATAGVPIVATQLAIQRREVGAQAQAGFSSPGQLVGRIPRRRLAAGVAPAQDDFAQDDFAKGVPLRRGDPVLLLARVGGVEVRMQGRALGPAQADGRIAVENTVSHRILRGRVAGDAVVELVP
jgi:flagellar basal body P-ring formation protein FlgA